MLDLFISAFTSLVFSGVITGKLELESLCYTKEGKQVTDCRLNSYFFELEDKQFKRGLQRVTPEVFSRQRVGDWLGCNASICLDMPKKGVLK